MPMVGGYPISACGRAMCCGRVKGLPWNDPSRRRCPTVCPSPRGRRWSLRGPKDSTLYWCAMHLSPGRVAIAIWEARR